MLPDIPDLDDRHGFNRRNREQFSPTETHPYFAGGRHFHTDDLQIHSSPRISKSRGTFLAANNTDSHMARATTPSRTRTTRSAEPAPKKRLGRPVGSKNRVTAATKTKTKAKTAPAAARRSTPARRTAPAAPKMNKAELEAQVAKLERAVARLRKQNAELKQSTREEHVEPPKAAPAPAAAPAKPKRAAAPRARRAAKAPVGQDDASTDDHGEIDSSDD
ncbi:MAG: hypothetical protein ACRYGL_04155 [Janthinobacterium lividum]